MNLYTIKAEDLENVDHAVAEIDNLKAICVIGFSQKDDWTEITVEATQEGVEAARKVLRKNMDGGEIRENIVSEDDYFKWY